MLVDLKSELGLTYVFISHDLNVVQYLSDRVLVMYLGKIVELAPKRSLFAMPRHPYTQALLSAVPVPDPTQRSRTTQIVLSGDVPSPADPPSGCRFRTRCWKATEKCAVDPPALIDRGQGHPSACHYAEVQVVI